MTAAELVSRSIENRVVATVSYDAILDEELTGVVAVAGGMRHDFGDHVMFAGPHWMVRLNNVFEIVWQDADAPDRERYRTAVDRAIRMAYPDAQVRLSHIQHGTAVTVRGVDGHRVRDIAATVRDIEVQVWYDGRY